jgi:hypothetical protein
MFLLALLLGWSATAPLRMSATPSCSVGWTVQPYSLDEILAAIRSVETGGEPRGGRDARGDGGRALGPYQIHRAYWLDAGVPGRYEDCRDERYARRVVLAYFERWCPTALARCDAEVLARVHNGGPGGRSKTSTLPYWRRVKVRLEEARSHWRANDHNYPQASIADTHKSQDAAPLERH